MRPNFSQNIFRAIFYREGLFFLKKVSVIAFRGVCFFTPILGKREIVPIQKFENTKMQNTKLEIEKLLTSTLCPNTEVHSLRAGLSPHKAQKPSKAGKNVMYFCLEICYFV